MEMHVRCQLPTPAQKLAQHALPSQQLSEDSRGQADGCRPANLHSSWAARLSVAAGEQQQNSGPGAWRCHTLGAAVSPGWQCSSVRCNWLQFATPTCRQHPPASCRLRNTEQSHAWSSRLLAHSCPAASHQPVVTAVHSNCSSICSWSTAPRQRVPAQCLPAAAAHLEATP